MKALAGLGLLLAALIAMNGCGSSGDAAELSGPTVSKAQFLKLGNKICSEETAKMQKAYNEWESRHTINGKRPPETARDKALSQIALATKRRELPLLKEIGLPREGELTVRNIFLSWEEGIERAEDDLSLMQGSYEHYAFNRPYRMSVNYGLTTCWWD